MPFAASLRSELSTWSKTTSLIHGQFRIGLDILPLILLFMILDRYFLWVARLPEESYFGSLIVLEFVQQLPWHFYLVAATAIGLLALRKGVRRLGQGWESVTQHRFLRPLVLLCTFILAWTYSTYHFNLYFNQSHIVDRLLLILLLGLVYWRPIFVFPFALMVLPIMGQFDYPILGFSRSEQMLLWRILMLFGAALLLELGAGRRQRLLVFTLLCLVAAHYWWPGLGKLRINWLAIEHLNFLAFFAYSQGIWSFIPEAQFTSLVDYLGYLNLPMMLFTLLVEAGSLLSLKSARWFSWFSVGRILLHGGIVLFAGIFFWKWILLNAMLIYLLRHRFRGPETRIFTPAHFLFSIGLIGAGYFWFQPTNFSWYDTRLHYTYHFEAVGESGATYDLPARYLAPYEYQFTLGLFGYLVEVPQVFIQGGGASTQLVSAIDGARTLADVQAIESTFGGFPYVAARAERFDRFMVTVMSNRNRRGTKSAWWHWLTAPPQLIAGSGRNPYDETEAIRAVNVYQHTSLYDEVRYSIIRRLHVRQVLIPDVATRITGEDGR